MVPISRPARDTQAELVARHAYQLNVLNGPDTVIMMATEELPSEVVRTVPEKLPSRLTERLGLCSMARSQMDYRCYMLVITQGALTSIIFG